MTSLFPFQVDSPDQKFQEIISAVVDTVSMMCSCTFTQDNIQNNEFSCRGTENTVVFRAEITYTSFTFTAAQLVDFVSQWVQSAPSFVVGPSMSRINVDTNCPTQLDSFLSEDCVSVDQGKTQSIGAVIGGVVAGVCVVLIFTGIVIAVLFIQKRKKKSFRYECGVAFSNYIVLVSIHSLLLALQQKKSSSLVTLYRWIPIQLMEAQ